MSFLTTSADEVSVCLTCVVRIPPTAYTLCKDLGNKIAVVINNNNNKVWYVTRGVCLKTWEKKEKSLFFLAISGCAEVKSVDVFTILLMLC